MGELGNRIWRMRRDGGVLPRSETQDIATRDEAYAIQAAAVIASGLTPLGWKVAATSEAAQQLLNMGGPSLGPVFAEHLLDSPATVVARPDQSTGTECEFAFVMGQDLDADADVDLQTVTDAIDHALVAVEVVGCRFEGGIADAGALLCISDFSFGAGLVRGPVVADWRTVDFAAATARAILNGTEVAAGTGAAVLGDPLEALHWAAGEAARIGSPLRAGDIVTTGTMTGATPVKPGDHFTGDFGPFGTVEIDFVVD